MFVVVVVSERSGSFVTSAAGATEVSDADPAGIPSGASLLLLSWRFEPAEGGSDSISESINLVLTRVKKRTIYSELVSNLI